MQEPKYGEFFLQIIDGLVKYYGTSRGPRAARVSTALSMRGLQSQPEAIQSSSASKSSPSGRAEMFVGRVMNVLSLLVKPSLHSNLRNSLFDLAVSAISVWDITQTDERQFVAYPTLDPEWFAGSNEGNSASKYKGVIVLFPRIGAGICPRVDKTRPVGPPGMWTDPEPEHSIQETCIVDGDGLAKWSALVVDGQQEVEESNKEEERKDLEEKKRVVEESLERLQKKDVTHRRGSLQSQRDSITESGSSPSLLWMKGVPKIPERV